MSCQRQAFHIWPEACRKHINFGKRTTTPNGILPLFEFVAGAYTSHQIVRQEGRDIRAKCVTDTSSDQDQKTSNLKPLARLIPYLMAYKPQVIAALVFLCVAAAATLTLPIAVRRMLDGGFSMSDSTLIGNYFLALIGLAAILALSSAARYYFVIWLGERVVADLRKDVFTHITKLSAEFFDTAKTGELVSRLTADTTQIKSAAGATASMALRQSVLMVGATIMMVYTSPWLSAIVLVAIPVIVLPIFAFGRAVRRRARNAQDTLADATAYASESISSVKTLQAFTNETLVSNSFGKSVERAFHAAKASVLARAFLTAFAIFTIFTSVVAVLWIGANAVIEGSMTPGTLGQFLLYSVFAAGALGGLSEVWGELSQAAGAAERLSELLATKADIAQPQNPVAFPSPPVGSVSFKDVDFAYPTRPDQSIVKGINLEIEPGETVALVGASGAGKSTIFSLILRYYDASAGTVLLDGVNVKEADPQDLRRRVSVVPQDTVVFGSSAADNIRFGRPDASDEEVREAAQLALADEFIERMEHGFDTVVGERGITLSGGQRQGSLLPEPF